MFRKNYDLSIIAEERESTMKISARHLDLIQVAFTQDIIHDGSLLLQAVENLIHYNQSVKNPDSIIHFQQLKAKLDQFFDQKLEIKTEDELELVSNVCIQMNELIQLLLKQQEKNDEEVSNLARSTKSNPVLQQAKVGLEQSLRGIQVNQIIEEDKQQQEDEDTSIKQEQQQNGQFHTQFPWENDFNVIKRSSELPNEIEINQQNNQADIFPIQLDQQIQILNIKIQKYQDTIDQMKYYYEEKQLDVVEKCRIIFEQQTVQLMNDKEVYQQASLLYDSNKEFAEEMRKQYNNMMYQLKWINEKNGWTLEKQSKSISVSYRKIPNSEFLVIRTEAILDINITHLISLIYEIELYPKWMPFCKHGKQLKKVDKAQKAVYLKCDLPIISDRELYVRGQGIDRMPENGTVLIIANTFDKNKEEQLKMEIPIPETSKCVRIDMPFFTFQIKPLTLGKMQLIQVGNLDCKLNFVPNGVINFVMRKFSMNLFKRMLSKSQNFENSPWHQSIKNDQQFYSWIEQKMKYYFDDKGELKIIQNSNVNQNSKQSEYNKADEKNINI